MSSPWVDPDTGWVGLIEDESDAPIHYAPERPSIFERNAERVLLAGVVISLKAWRAYKLTRYQLADMRHRTAR